MACYAHKCIGSVYSQLAERGREEVGADWRGLTVCVCHAKAFNGSSRVVVGVILLIKISTSVARWRVCCGILFKLLATPCF